MGPDTGISLLHPDLKRARVEATVEQQVVPGQVTGVCAAVEGAHGTQLFHAPKAPCRATLLPCGLFLFQRAPGCAGDFAQVRYQPVGFKKLGRQVVDGDVGLHIAAGDGLHKAGQPEPRRDRQRQRRYRCFDQRRADVDDAAEVALGK